LGVRIITPLSSSAAISTIIISGAIKSTATISTWTSRRFNIHIVPIFILSEELRHACFGSKSHLLPDMLVLTICFCVFLVPSLTLSDALFVGGVRKFIFYPPPKLLSSGQLSSLLPRRQLMLICRTNILILHMMAMIHYLCALGSRERSQVLLIVVGMMPY
jgi:hypothetical protein